MYILVLGGTGAMGVPLVRILSGQNNVVYVTSRKAHTSGDDRVKYLQGNALDRKFLLECLSLCQWDAIVDFMVHPLHEFEEVVPFLLGHTKQYIYISSSRVYAETPGKISEDTPRLLDVSEDAAYLATEEYALAKAREENVLRNSGHTNYTIVRPYITYNTYRLQLGTLEKESWLYRALHGRTIVFSKDLVDKQTTMTLGDDVSKGIASLIGKEQALGEAFHITCDKPMSWGEVLSVYLKVLEQHSGGRKVPVLLTEKSTNLVFPWKRYQLLYCRYFNRCFDNSKISRFCDVQEFTSPEAGIAQCLHSFLEAPRFGAVDWYIEAVNDRVSGERTPLHEIPSLRDRINYLSYRYRLLGYCLYPVKAFLGIVKKICKKG